MHPWNKPCIVRMYVFLHIIEFYLLILCFKICIYTHKGYEFVVFSMCACVCVCMHAHTILGQYWPQNSSWELFPPLFIFWKRLHAVAVAAKSLQSCPTLCDPIDRSPSGSTVPGILQARTLEWVAIAFSNAWKWKVKVKSLSCVRLPATPWAAAYQAPLSMGFSRQEYWSGVPLPSLSRDLLTKLAFCLKR